MKIIGMLDSPYVRRVVVSAKLMNLSVDHEALSVFRDFDRLQSINPLVKAPTLVFEDDTVMVDSTLILQYFETLCAIGKRLTPIDPETRERSLRLTGYALVACEKAVQLYYETDKRPEALRWDEWIVRSRGQLRAAFNMLEANAGSKRWLCDDTWLTHADVASAVAWRFAHHMVPTAVDGLACPRLTEHSAAAEALPAFQAADF